MRTLLTIRFILSYPFSQLFPWQVINIYVTFLVVFLGLFFVSVVKIFKVSSNQIWSLLIWKESTQFHFPWKQKNSLIPQHNIFSEFHFKVMTILKYLGWFNSALTFIIWCLSSAVVHSSAFKVNKTTYRFQTPGVFPIIVSLIFILLYLVNF